MSQKRQTERARLPLLLLALLAERPMHGYELNQQIEARQIRQWANVSLSSIYQTLERMVAEGLLQAREEANPGQGATYRTVYALADVGRAQLEQRAQEALASTEHQRFDYDLGLGVALTHLPLAQVRQALEERRAALQKRFERASAACQWAEQMLGAWVVLDHQCRALEMELSWLGDVIARLDKEEKKE